MKLWYKEKSWYCPQCKHLSLWHPNELEEDANFYCVRCMSHWHLVEGQTAGEEYDIEIEKYAKSLKCNKDVIKNGCL